MRELIVWHFVKTIILNFGYCEIVRDFFLVSVQSCLLMQNTDAPEAVSDDIPAPSRSEIIQCLGSPLAEIFLEYIRPKKQNFCSSGDYNAAEFQERNYDQFLQTQTALRPPPIDPKVKALTHEGILSKFFF